MLKDPYFNKPIVLIYSNKIKFKDIIYVPYKTLNNKSLLECIIVDKIYIKDIGYKYNVMIGKSNDKFSIDGIDMNGLEWYADPNMKNLSGGECPKEVLWRTEKSESRSVESDNYPPSVYGNGRINPTQNIIPLQGGGDSRFIAI